MSLADFSASARDFNVRPLRASWLLLMQSMHAFFPGMVPELTYRPNIFSTLLFSSVVHRFFTTKPEKMKLWLTDIHFEQLYNTEKRFRNDFVLKFSFSSHVDPNIYGNGFFWWASLSSLCFCIQTWLLFPISNTVKAHELEPVRLNSLLVRPSQVTGGLHVFVWLVLHYYLFKDESFSGCRDVTQGNSNTVTLAKTIWKLRWLVRAIKSTSFFTSTVIWSTLISVNRHL